MAVILQQLLTTNLLSSNQPMAEGENVAAGPAADVTIPSSFGIPPDGEEEGDDEEDEDGDIDIHEDEPSSSRKDGGDDDDDDGPSLLSSKAA